MVDVMLSVDGLVLREWTDVAIVRSMEQLASGFSFSTSQLWHVRGQDVPLGCGSECTIAARGITLITGYIDAIEETYEGHEHRLTVQGRSRLGDVIDCSVSPSRAYSQQSLEQIAGSICSPFDISVESERLARPQIRRFATQEGEKVSEALDRLARSEGVLLGETMQGNLLVWSGIYLQAPETLSTGPGGRILSGMRHTSWEERFSSYTVLGQAAEDDNLFGRAAAAVKATVSDSSINRTRPLVMVGDAQLDRASAAKRAKWERNVRQAKSTRLSYRVRGWECGDGLWMPGQTIPVRDDILGISDTLLCSAVMLKRSMSGEIAELELVRPEALNVLAEPPAKTSRESVLPW